MKSPWTSLGLSAANRAVGATRGMWSAQARRQQQAVAQAMAKEWAKASGLGTSATRKPASQTSAEIGRTLPGGSAGG